ncbi:XrtA/PEP-CTERM system TPR-repeat protein PrsT [Methylohalobius crimeensis]|uniref:XrtA/PEP-CTERM system TPR-repeat protein PrsT n=1 Tax=Methylohalobius crimeensis TaxID=244365 RepID=UPI0003B79D02|nr:XrtA/PEP-CTERM system TPR-repeat protein PrsT [Methylohalobius crimeensis]
MAHSALSLRRLSVALIAALTISACSPDLTDAEHISRAKEYQAQGDLRASIIELKNALQKNPKNPEARRLLGQLYVQAGNGASAEKELRRAVELGVAKEAIMISLAEALILQNKHREILDKIEVPPNLPPQQQVKLMSLRGDAWLMVGNLDNAEAEYRRGLAIDPQAPLPKLGMARLAAKNNDLGRAERLLDEALQVAPEEGRLWRFKAELARVAENYEEAEEAYDKAIDFNTINISDLVDRALVRIERQKYAGATEDIQRLQKIAPRYFMTHYAAGLLALQQKRYAEAQTQLEQVLTLNNQYLPGYYFLGVAHLLQNHLAQAEENLSRFMTSAPNSVRARKVLALTQLRLGAAKEAKKTLEPVLLFQPENRVVLEIMSKIEFALGNQDKGIEYLQKMVGLEPESAEYRTKLGLGLLAGGESELGIKELKEALVQDPGLIPAKVQLALSYLRTKKFNEAEELIQSLQDEKDLVDSALPFNLLGALQLARGESEQAESTFQMAWEREPGNPAIAHNLAQFAIKDQKYSDARDLYEVVLKRHPKDLATQLRLAELDEKEGKLEDFRQKLEQAVSDHPESLAPHVILAQFYLNYGEFQKAQTLVEKILPRYPQQVDLLMLLVKAQMQTDQLTSARESVQQLLEASPSSAEAHYLAGKVALGNDDFVKAERMWKKAAELDPAFIPARLALIKLKLSQNKIQQAQEDAQRLFENYPDNAGVLAFRAELAMKSGDWEAVISNYEKALAQSADSSWTINLARAYWFSGDKKRSEEILKTWMSKHPGDGSAAYAYANLLWKSDRLDETIDRLRALLKIYPDHAMALNDLAWLLRNKAPREALRYAERAVKLMPESARMRDTLAWTLSINGNNSRALEEMQLAVAKQPENPLIQYHWAKLLIADGQKNKARQVLESLLTQAEQFPKRPAAQALLKDLHPD